LLRLFGIPASMLPEVRWSSERIGVVNTSLGWGGLRLRGLPAISRRRCLGSFVFIGG
jgi:glycerol kinase